MMENGELRSVALVLSVDDSAKKHFSFLYFAPRIIAKVWGKVKMNFMVFGNIQHCSYPERGGRVNLC